MAYSGLTDKQAKYSAFIARGEKEIDAVVKAGYEKKSKHQVLQKLKKSDKVNEYIKTLSKHPELVEKEQAEEKKKEEEAKEFQGVADRKTREEFWTEMMMNPKNSGPVRLEASKLLGKAQGDFSDKKNEKTDNKNPVLVIPSSNPKEWEKYWEKQNKDNKESKND